MGKPETIRDYLDTVEEQIRWKRARPIVALELERHLQDQRDAFAEEGIPAAEAERLAVEEMGDPVTVGTELDHLHRPRPQWGLLALTMLLALAGGFLRVWLPISCVEFPYGHTIRTVNALVLGTACLLGGYFLDYTWLIRHSRAVYISALILGVLSLKLPPCTNNASYYTRYVVLCYPTVYAIWLYQCRKKGWIGVLLAILGGIPLAAIGLLVPYVTAVVLLLLTGFFLLLAAAGMDWFGIGWRRMAAVVTGIAALIVGGIGFLISNGYGRSRIIAFFHPEIDPLCKGYQAMSVRKALSASRWLGEGTWSLPFERTVPEWDRDFLLTTVIYKLGWLVFLGLVLAIAGLLLWVLCRCLRQRSQTGRLIALSVVLPLALQVVFSIVLNLGYVLFSVTMPLFVGNLHTVVDMALIGLALSVFRGESISQEDDKKAEAMMHVRISFQNERDAQNSSRVLGISLIFSRDETKVMERSFL